MSKQRNKIIFVIVISMVLSACAVHEVPKENERYIEETRDSYLNFWIVNSETKELIPEKIFNEESEEEYIIWNERYLDMLDLYSEESE